MSYIMWEEAWSFLPTFLHKRSTLSVEAIVGLSVLPPIHGTTNHSGLVENYHTAGFTQLQVSIIHQHLYW